MLKKRSIISAVLICTTAVIMAVQPAFAARYISDGNGATVYYDDGSYVEYNARGSTIYVYDQWGDLIDEKYAQLTEAQFKKQYYTNKSSKSSSSSSNKYAGASIYDAYWGNNNSRLIAHWDADYQSKGKYTVTLYRDSHKVTSKTSSGGKSVDFTDTIANYNKTGDYYFTVKGSWSGHTDSTTSDYTYVDSAFLDRIRRNSGSGSSGSASGPGGSPATVAGPAGNVGWQNYNGTWKYMKTNGQYAANAWELINGKWYYFDGAGNMAANQWVQTDAWYYVGPNGDMLANQWIQSRTNSHIWYYVGGDGRMVTNSVINGWPINANGECYY